MITSFPRLAGALCVLTISLPGASAAPPVERPIRVDCDRGDSLQTVLRRVGSGRASIFVTGTCRGEFPVTGEAVEIVGVSAQESLLRGPMTVSGRGSLILRKLGMTTQDGGGGTAISIQGPERSVLVEDCDIFDSNYGVMALLGARVALARTQVHGMVYAGLSAGGQSVIDVRDGAIRDNYEGIRISQSSLLLYGAAVTGSSNLGVLAESLSTVQTIQTSFLNNGQLHVGVRDRSHAALLDSQVGQDGDPTGFSVGADADSRVSVDFQNPGTLHGVASAYSGSKLTVQGATLQDGAILGDFSWLKLTDAAVVGAIVCQTGSDAICASGSSAAVSGCGPVSASCGGEPAPAALRPVFPRFLTAAPAPPSIAR